MEAIEERVGPKPQIVKQAIKLNKKLSPESLKLNKVYFVPWVLTFILSIAIILYNWFYIEIECWNDKCKRSTIMVSLMLSVTNMFTLNSLCVISCFFDNNASIGRVRFYTLAFGLICIVSVFNLILGIFTFMQKSCYLMLQVPEDRVNGANLFRIFSIKYDIKLAGVLHVFVAMFGFMVSMAFAIIKNNYKYIKQINLES